MFAVDEDENGTALQQALELAASGSSRLPSVDLEREVVPSLPTLPGLPPFEPLSDSDVYDIFDLELALEAGGKEAGIDARYRSSDSSSGRPTYKIRKKTRAHFLGKKNMTVDVSRSLAWDPTTATATPKGSKSYANVFSAHDQSSRRVALQATNSVLSKTSAGAVIDVSTLCGAYDPTRTLHRDTTAHHFFTLKLNPSCAPEKPVTRKRGGGTPIGPASASPSGTDPQPYIGGGHFVLDSGAPPERSDLLTTLYCTGYEQRARVRAGDIAVAEIRLSPRPLEPGVVPPSPWARFFKERHAVLHIARRGLGACMTGPHVQMSVPGVERAVLARGQALEVVLAVVGTALMVVEHDGLEGKRWAWLAQRGAVAPSAGLSRMATPTGPGTGTALSRTTTETGMSVTLSRTASRTGTSTPLSRTGTRTLQLSPLASPPAVADNPGLASPDGEGTDAHSDDSQNSPTPGAFDQYRLFAPPGHYQDRQGFVPPDGGSVGGNGEGLDDWVVADDAAHPGEAARAEAGAWARKSTVTSYSESTTLGSQQQDVHHQHQHEHLKVGSWPGPERRSVIRVLERPQSQAGLDENPNWTPKANRQGEQGHADGSVTFAMSENSLGGLDGNPNAHTSANPDAPNANVNRAPVGSTLSRMWMKKQQQPTPHPHPTPQEYMY